MTTNQTIDGVPRELIQWLVDHEEFLDFGGREPDLRALLKAKPKAEPVAYLCKAGASKWLQYGAQVSDPWRPDEVELTPLYAEQPAPVAVPLDYVHDGGNDQRGEAAHAADGYQSAGDGGGEVVRIEYSSLDPVERLAVCRGEQPVAVVMP